MTVAGPFLRVLTLSSLVFRVTSVSVSEQEKLNEQLPSLSVEVVRRKPSTYSESSLADESGYCRRLILCWQPHDQLKDSQCCQEVRDSTVHLRPLGVRIGAQLHCRHRRAWKMSLQANK